MTTVFKNYEMDVIENAFLPLFIGSQPLNERSSLRSQFCKMRHFWWFLNSVLFPRVGLLTHIRTVSCDTIVYDHF